MIYTSACFAVPIQPKDPTPQPLRRFSSTDAEWCYGYMVLLLCGSFTAGKRITIHPFIH
jgi:hypothetical protein